MTAPTVARRGVFGQPALPWIPLPYMDEYMLGLEVEGRSKDSIRPVRAGLSHFSSFCQIESIGHPEQIKREHLIRYQAWLNGKPISPRYKTQLLKYLRGWLSWLVKTGYLMNDPWVNIKIQRLGKKPNPLEDEEIEGLFAAHKQQAFSLPPFLFHRREVILTLLYGWGLRIHELHSLNVTQLDLRLEWVTVRNKGGGTKTLPYGDVLKEVVQRWLRQRGGKAQIGEDALLIDQDGKRLSIQMIRKIVTELGDRSGIPVNPHRLRDSCGTSLLDADVPVERVMKILGHSTQAQTLAYSRVNDHKVKESHDAAMNSRLGGLLFKRTGDPSGPNAQ